MALKKNSLTLPLVLYTEFDSTYNKNQAAGQDILISRQMVVLKFRPTQLNRPIRSKISKKACQNAGVYFKNHFVLSAR
jgi:hypothetical protein